MEEAVEPGAADTEVFSWYVQHITAYFYAYNGILDLTRLACLQRAFTSLTKIFDRVGLRTNVANMVIMFCHCLGALGGHYTETYSLRIMGKGNTYQERIF